MIGDGLSYLLLSVAGSAGIVFLLPTLSDLASLLSVWRGGGRHSEAQLPEERTPTKGDGERFLFLVPAHDEELLIRRCIEALHALDYTPDRYEIVIVADNCTDGTATVAREGGVRCLERTDPVRRGKPYAIAWALQRLDTSRFEAVVIIDADTRIDPSYAKAMAAAGPLAEGASQAYNGVSNPDESAITRLSALLSHAYYEYMYPLKQRAGLNPPLTGAGMCVGTRVLAEHGWQAFSICEDVETWVQLTLQGVRTQCVPSAKVASQEAKSLSQSYSQRKRWRGGRIALATRYAGTVSASRSIGLHQKIDILAELTVPGPVTHVTLALLLGSAVLAWGAPGATAVAGLLGASLVRPFVYGAAAFAAEPQKGALLRAFLALPAYGIWRVGTEIVALATAGRDTWVRTRRHSEPEE